MTLLNDEATDRVTAADPQPDEFGGCAQCGGERPKPTRSVPKRNENPEHRAAAEVKRQVIHKQILAAAREDPFCSADCCREWYGVEVSSYSMWPRKTPAN